MSAPLGRRLIGWFLTEAATGDPGVRDTKTAGGAPSATVVLATEGELPLAASLTAAAVATHAGGPALVCLWPGGALPARGRGRTTRRARAAADRMAARSVDARALGDAVFIALPDDARACRRAVERACMTADPGPLVVALGGPRSAELEELVAGADRVVVAFASAAGRAVAELASELSGRPGGVVEIPSGPLRAGLLRLGPLRAAKRAEIAALTSCLPGGGERRSAAGSWIGRWLRESSGQTSIAALIATFVLVLLGGAVAAVAAAVSAHGARQQAADLGALAGARVLRDLRPRLFEPAVTGGVQNASHIEREELLRRAERLAAATARANGAERASARVTDRSALAPGRIEVTASAPIEVAGARIGVRARAQAEVAAENGVDGGGASLAGQYRGPFATRQGRPMRPDVAFAFDRMVTAARADGVALIVRSAFRSDAEQAVLFARHPDPKWVAPPGRSLHRLGTELDLDGPGAHGWLARNADRFGFRQRYSWEPWHYGFVRSAGSRSVGYGPADGRRGMPSFVPERYAPIIAAAAQRWNVGAALLAAQLYQESGFNPFALSRAGAGGIAQFMPATARAYGLAGADRFDPTKAIPAQAHHMHDLLRRFGSVPLALAAYNAGPQPVERCGCIPPYRETQAYVAAILALLAGAGDGDGLGSRLTIRLVE